MPEYKKTANKKNSKSQNSKKQAAKGLNFVRILCFWALVLFIISLATGGVNGLVGDVDDKDNEKTITEVLQLAEEEKIDQITVKGDELEVEMKAEEGKDPKVYKSRKDARGTLQEQGFEQVINDKKVKVKIVPEVDYGMIIFDALTFILPIALIIFVFSRIMKQAQNMNSQSMGFSKSKARLYGNEKKKVLFDDVAGNEAAKQDLSEVVDFLKNPKRYEKLGAKIPRGVLLAGEPGTGKTLMARAVAGEANVPFFSISGSEFAEMFVGVGASRVRDLFSKAKKNAPSIIFIDEIDAVAHKRDSRGGAGREDEQTLNQILVEMDGFDNESGVIVIAATNRVDMLDKALLRPGRFDRHVNVTLPERKDRIEILKVHFKNKPVDDTVDLDALAAKTAGSSGADLANIANEAAIAAARANRDKITNQDITEAFERIAIGPERKSKVMNEAERKITAYHEAGHAIVGHVLPDSDPVHKITIIPRGCTGGVTWFLPPEDRSYKNVYELKDVLARAMGGRVAERIINGVDGITTGASSDLKHVAELSREMVTEEGMGNKLRDRVFASDEANFLGDRVKNYSEKTSEMIDAEIEALSKEADDRAEKILRANREFLDKLAAALLEKETLDAPEVEKILKGAKLPDTVKLHD